MKSWYEIKNKAGGVVDISLHDEIGLWGVSAADFIKDLRGHSDVKSINLSIHSPGGSVLDGLAMYNSLKSHPAKVYGKVEGIAASAASFVLMASDHIEMPEDAFIMIHNAWGVAMGDPDDIRDTADIMEKLQDSIINIYEKRTGKDSAELAEMMKQETWMNAADALEHGFIDTITDAVDVAAKIGAFNKYFKSMPVKNTKKPDGIETERDFERYLRDSGISKGLATALTSRAKVVFQGEPDDTEDELAQLSARLGKFSI